ncbi:MAG TPA: hypothetical protein VK179_12420 [Bacteroidales bacterium]|nr:hypothetical protein [Bacteroidales bacterium]
MKYTSENVCKNTLVFLFVLFAFGCSCYANQSLNDSVKSPVEISVFGGLWNLASIDEMYSFQKFYGDHMFWGLSFALTSTRHRHLITVQYSEITRRPENFIYTEGLVEQRYKQMKSLLVDVDYSYQRLVLQGNLSVYVLMNCMNASNYTLKEDDPEIFLSSVAPGVELQYRKKKHYFGLDITIPVISLALREPYYISNPQTGDHISQMEHIEDNLKVQSFGSLKVLNSLVHYQYRFSQQVAFDARYQYRYISDRVPRPLRSVSGIYSAGLTFIF